MGSRSLFLQQGMDIFAQLVELIRFQAVIDLADAAATVDKGKELGMQELLVDVKGIVLRVIEQVAGTGKVIETVFAPGEEIPFAGIGAKRVRIVFHTADTVCLRVDGIGKKPKVRL